MNTEQGDKSFDPVASAQAEAWETNWRKTPEGQRNQTMNTEQVVEMIDAITEGRYYAHGFETKRGSHSLSIEVGNAEGDDEFWFSSFNAEFLAKINDPRVAREIAGALVAWANRKEGTPIKATDLMKSDSRVVNLRQISVTSIAKNEPPANCNQPRVWHASKVHRRFHYVNNECSLEKEGPENDV